MKLYVSTLHMFIQPHLVEAIGHPDHMRQARIHVTGLNKTEAVNLANSRGILTTARELRVGNGDNEDAITRAGLVTPGRVLIENDRTRDIYDVTPDAVTRIGKLDRDRYETRFITY